ncbi:UNVERIFIED_CONTAM: hypothetical protein PYX00_003270 [Menopon gallinae]|uniref:Uncharacterized protein n=1 Tax=Menopon gallinae TaxID=328185 RepID=A0AAW2HZR9_9NEOP
MKYSRLVFGKGLVSLFQALRIAIKFDLLAFINDSFILCRHKRISISVIPGEEITPSHNPVLLFPSETIESWLKRVKNTLLRDGSSNSMQRITTNYHFTKDVNTHQKIVNDMLQLL